MTTNYFVKMMCSLRGKRIRPKYINFHNQSTWKKPVTILSMLQSNQQYQDDNKYNQQFLIGASLGFLGIFNFNKEDLEPVPELIMTVKRSIFLIQKGEYKKAEQMLHVALRQAQFLQHFDGITYVYDVMANLAFEVGENKKAKDLFTLVMQRLISTGTAQNDKKIIHISLKMAKILERMGDTQTAEDGYIYCLIHAKTHVNSDPDDEDATILCAVAHDWYGNFLLSEDRFKEAQNNYLSAYELCLKVYGKDHERTTVILNDLGTVCCCLGEYDHALNYLTEAAKIGKQLSNQEYLSVIYINLGKVYIKKILSEEARKACEEGLRLAKENNDENCKERASECLLEVEKILT